MSFIDSIYERATVKNSKIAFPECENETMMKIAAKASEAGYVTPVAVGVEAELRAMCVERGIDENLFEFADVENLEYREALAERYAQLPDVMIGKKGIVRRTEDPLCLSLVLEKLGDVGCTFCGFVAPTEEVILAGQMILGQDEEIPVLSSCGFFEVEDFQGQGKKIFGYGDSAICVNPDAEELATIAISCCDTFKKILGYDPRCALLCYSTCGSGEGPAIEKVREAVTIAQKARPELMIDGEFQLDAAINPNIGKKKVTRESEVAGQADLLIWPDLNVGNIGLKLVQQFAKPKCYGPVLQGFSKPLIDVSRGESEQSLFDTIVMASVLSAG